MQKILKRILYIEEEDKCHHRYTGKNKSHQMTKKVNEYW
jgi:hypothetical protein